MKIQAWNKVGQDWVATDSVGHVIGVIRRIPMLESIQPDNASKTMIDRLNELPTSKIVRLKVENERFARMGDKVREMKMTKEEKKQRREELYEKLKAL